MFCKSSLNDIFLSNRIIHFLCDHKLYLFAHLYFFNWFLTFNLLTYQYIFRNHIWFGKCNYYLFKIKNSCCLMRYFLCILIEFAIPNLSLIYFLYLKIFKMNVQNRFLSTKSPFLICVLVLLILKGYFIYSLKNGVKY